MLPTTYRFLNLQIINVVICGFQYQYKNYIQNQNENKNHIQNQNYIELKYLNVYNIHTYRFKFIRL